MKAVLIVTGVLALSGCSSMFNGTSQQVGIRSNMDDAKLYVNEQYIGKGSGVTTFKKKNNYIIVARKDGCVDASVPASKSFDATTLLGVFLYGVPIVIDGVTGAWSQFDQTSYVLDPNCTSN
jgi:hypothetical protein